METFPHQVEVEHVAKYEREKGVGYDDSVLCVVVAFVWHVASYPTFELSRSFSEDIIDGNGLADKDT